jgi:hypothetical protein
MTKPVEKSDSPKPGAAAVRETVPKHRQCPSCFGMHGGVGQAYATKGERRYYKCDRCTFTWAVTIQVERIGHHEVPVDVRGED